MFKRALVLMATIMAMVSVPLLAQSSGAASTAPAAPLRSGYAPVDGLRLYYEIYGTGQPLVLLHGGLGSIEMFGPVLAELAKTREVIGVDLQGHGRTADIDRPIRYELMADDIAALLTYLGIPKADIMGYSLGGGVALQVAIRHPEVVRELVVVSCASKRDGWYPEILAGEAQMSAASAEQMKQTPIYQMYASLAPRPQDWPEFAAKLGALLKRDYDWTNDIKTIKAPTLLVFADQDAVQISNITAFFSLFGGGQHAPTWDGSESPTAQLAILPGVTHFNIFASPLLASVAAAFLESPQ